MLKTQSDTRLPLLVSLVSLQGETVSAIILETSFLQLWYQSHNWQSAACFHCLLYFLTISSSTHQENMSTDTPSVFHPASVPPSLSFTKIVPWAFFPSFSERRRLWLKLVNFLWANELTAVFPRLSNETEWEVGGGCCLATAGRTGSRWSHCLIRGPQETSHALFCDINVKKKKRCTCKVRQKKP